jgi:hypothetical protein
VRGSCPSTVECGFVICDIVLGLVLSLFPVFCADDGLAQWRFYHISGSEREE